MPSLRQIRRRIRSVEGTKKMTHAMEMVSAAKLKRLQGMLAESSHYVGELKRILGALTQNSGEIDHPLIQKHVEMKSALIFLITSDTGLCGAYNANVINEVRKLLNEMLLSPSPLPLQGGEGKGKGVRKKQISFMAIGRKGAAFLRRSNLEIREFISVPKPQEIGETIRQVTKLATEAYTQGRADEVFFAYTQAESLSALKPAVEQFLPFVAEKIGTESNESPIEYLLEPSPEKIVEWLFPEFIEAKIGQFVKHSLVAEQAARMMSMRQATDSAEEMIETLTLARNKARQAAITKELLEVVSGSRALKLE